MNKTFDSEPINNKKFLRTKIKSYRDGAIDLRDKKMPKVDSNYTCLAVILIDFVLKKYKNFYMQVFF